MRLPRRRLAIVVVSLVALFITSWLGLFIQKRHLFVGKGVSSAPFFLLINIHAIILMVLLYIVVRQSIKLFSERRKEKPGSLFRRNLFFAFTVFSVVPASFILFIAGKLISTSVDVWFQQYLGGGLTSGLVLHEHQTRDVRKKLCQVGEIFSKEFEEKWRTNFTLFAQQSADLKKEYPNHSFFIWSDSGDTLATTAPQKETAVWRQYGHLSGRTTKTLKKHFLQKLQESSATGRVFDFWGSTYWANRHQHEITGQPYYLIAVARYPVHIRTPLIALQTSSQNYERLKSLHNPIYAYYLLVFVMMTLLVLFLSLWCAFYLAKGISRPIQTLLDATEKIRKGRWDVHVDLDPSSDLNSLAIGFNEMTKALRLARTQLEETNKEVLTILEHINASVFFIGKFGRITTYNAASKKLVRNLLGLDRFKNEKVTFFGKDVAKTFFTLFKELKNSGQQQISREISLASRLGTRTLMVHFTFVHTPSREERKGLLVVIEDLTDIVKANKIKTWQEAARQMAHEIKNPLTPIQLATQRLRRKYRKMEEPDPALIECTDTILNQVTIIRNLVSHFSQFARMPDGRKERGDINELVKEVVCLYEVGYPAVEFACQLEEPLPLLPIDKSRLKRVLVNLFDNSLRAFAAIPNDRKNHIKLRTRFKTGRNQIELVFADDGPGIPAEVKDKLFMPHVSSSKKNMGLGLAIVHDAVSQMGGSVRLLPTPQGAAFQIMLPV